MRLGRAGPGIDLPCARALHANSLVPAVDTMDFSSAVGCTIFRNHDTLASASVLLISSPFLSRLGIHFLRLTR